MASSIDVENTVLNRRLREFAEVFLKPSEKELESAKAIVDKIANALKKSKKRYSISKVISAGSYGKATSLDQHFDIDLVAFVNDEEPPFEKVIEDFEDVLELSEQIEVTSIKKTQHSLQFKVDGIEIDLLPATNYTKGMNLEADEEVKQQQVLALAKIRSTFDRTGKYDSKYSSALAQSQVQFVKDRTAFIHILIRLCKFWMKTLDVEYVYGKSLIVELLATKSGEEEENNHTSANILRAFIGFLQSMMKFDSICLDFKKDGRTPDSIKKPPMILDPTNPYNNLAQGLDKVTVGKLKRFAEETHRRLCILIGNHYLGEQIPLEGVFEPQPRMAQPYQKVAIPMIEICGAVPYSHPKLIVRKSSKFPGDEIEKLKLRIQDFVVTQMQAFTASAKPGTTCLDVLNFVTGVVDRQVRGAEKMGWSGSSETEEQYDLTFIIPFTIDGCGMSCHVSFKK